MWTSPRRTSTRRWSSLSWRSAPEELERPNGEKVSVGPNQTMSKSAEELEPHMVLDSELYEGIVSQTIIEPKEDVPGYPGQIVANIGPLRTNVTFDHRDCSVTLLKNDHVLINLLINTLTNKRRAANIRPKIPFTFRYTKEIREQGTIASLGDQEGVVSSTKHGDLPFDLCENFSDAEFDSDDVGKDGVHSDNGQSRGQSDLRLRRMRRSKAAEDKILQEQKARELEERQRREEERRRRRRRRGGGRRRRPLLWQQPKTSGLRSASGTESLTPCWRSAGSASRAPCSKPSAGALPRKSRRRPSRRRCRRQM
ncbi:uncharacterized protein LOC129356093 [Poeciliopsis prolifica]|uniref:uncharacterized protein LOC129356093 n=1 Tax=Poeciliopsis prolifica TaxID=188132 RepID=UPI00241460E6|nr:uncharacterized protein LOC129356093 [Poeciliopsis prolifica]XP_054881683.1 uncharacterized protein LOC129356093 [Poeciliopsis prolifica]